MKSVFFMMTVLLAANSLAANSLEGNWYGRDGKQVELIEFDGKASLHTQSYYSNGATSDYFFDFQLPENREVQPGEIIKGRLRSIDGYYGCLFDEEAQMALDTNGNLKMNFPLLVFHREIRSVREDHGQVYRRYVDWTRWGYIEHIYSFPIYRWRVISNNCVIDKKINTTSILSR